MNVVYGWMRKNKEEMRDQPQGLWNFTESDTSAGSQIIGRWRHNLSVFCVVVSKQKQQLIFKVTYKALWEREGFHPTRWERKRGLTANIVGNPKRLCVCACMRVWVCVSVCASLCVCLHLDVFDRSVNQSHLPTRWAIQRLLYKVSVSLADRHVRKCVSL